MRIFTTAFVYVFLIIVKTIPLQAGVAEKDSLALVAVYDSTDGANWSNAWDLNTPVNGWWGITVVNDRVTKINLSGSITGTLPTQISDLDSLTYLRFYYTNLSGELPSDIGNLTRLETIDFSNNDLTGSIPESFYSLDSLKEIQLRQNSLTGTLSSDISTFSKLYLLNLSNNDLSGSIPPAIGDLPELVTLDLSSNDFDGNIPVEIGSLAKLEYLNLYRNKLAGTIPTEIGSLDSLTQLRLGNNDLAGEIPSSIGNLKKLTHLNLDQNDLTVLPAEIANCSNLESIRIGYNKLTTLPDLSDLTVLNDLWITNNELSGPFPDFLYSMSYLVGLNIGGNNFEGELKPDVANWQRLRWFYFGNNNLSGKIPKEVGTLQSVTFLELYSNNFEGEIPPEIADMSRLQYLRLHNNQLSGEIPDELGNATNLRQANFGNNQFEGGVPESFVQLKELERLYLTGNNLSYLPEFFGHPSLNRIEMQNNKFTFEDIEPLIQLNLQNFYYVPQDSALSEKQLYTPLNSAVTLNMKIGGSTNHYQWFKDDVEIVANDTIGLFSIGSLQEEDTGFYYCHVTSDSVDDLTIITSKIHLQIGESNLDSLALVDLYNATNGDEWSNKTNWLSNNPISTWYGVTAQNAVTELDLANNNLNGEIPASICNFHSLQSLNLSGNNLSGRIPAEVGSINSLATLNLSINELSGRVPENLALIDELNDLFLSHNQLSELPDLSAMPLTNFSVEANKLTFEDFEKNIATPAVFTYAPQDSIGPAAIDTVDQSESFTIQIQIGGSTNKYQWYKDGLMLDDATDSLLVVENVTSADSGLYVCAVTNDKVPDLTIYSRPSHIIVPGLTDIAQENYIKQPVTFALEQNFPNPFNPETTIKYTLPEAADVELMVYNVLGQQVAKLVDSKQQSGHHIVSFNAQHLASGVYFYVLQTEALSIKRKMILLK